MKSFYYEIKTSKIFYNLKVYYPSFFYNQNNSSFSIPTKNTYIFTLNINEMTLFFTGQC